MIAVDRSRVPRPVVLDLDDPNSPAAKELAKMLAHLDDPDANKKPSFRVYSDDPVKLALYELFHTKCAYCETSLRGSGLRDIEHYRPKNQIHPGGDGDIIEQGYYWLAADWDNLLLSCPGCNRRNRKLTVKPDGTIDFEEEPTGKLDRFPLRDEAKRVTSHLRDIADEEDARLLLNPFLDNPERHLRFDKEGNVIPRKIQGKVSDRALASIEVYSLARVMLKEDRKTRYLDLARVHKSIQFVGDVLNDTPDPMMTPDRVDGVAAEIRRHEVDLQALHDAKSPHAGVVRWLGRAALRELNAVKAAFADRFGRDP